MDDKNVPKYIKRNKRKGKVLPKILSQTTKKTMRFDTKKKKGNELNLVIKKKEKGFYIINSFISNRKDTKKKEINLT